MPAAVAAQVNTTQSNDTLHYSIATPSWAGQLTALSVNAMLGGLTAGLLQELRGGSFKDGFTRGTLGGAVTYTGKRVASRRFDGAGLLGREVGALGTSMVRNASVGKPVFDRLIFPVGPVSVYVEPGRRRFNASLDVVGAAWFAWAVAEPDLRLAVFESFTSGAPVFRTNNRLIVHRTSRTHGGGFTPAGIVLQSYVPAWGPHFLERVLVHERVHVIQEDQLMHTLVEPGSEWLLSKLPYGKQITRRIDTNVSAELLSVLSRFFDSYRSRPWELEAIYLSR